MREPPAEERKNTRKPNFLLFERRQQKISPLRGNEKKNTVCIEPEWYRHFRFESEQSEKWMFILQWAHKRNREKNTNIHENVNDEWEQMAKE